MKGRGRRNRRVELPAGDPVVTFRNGSAREGGRVRGF